MDESLAAEARRNRAARRHFASHWPEWLALVVALQCCLAAWAAARYHLSATLWFSYYLIWIVPAGAIYLGLFLWWLGRAYLSGEAHPISRIVSLIRAASPRALVETAVPIAVIPPFMTAFTVFKVSISRITTFWADPLLMKMDGVLGFQPWQLTHALFGPLGTYLIDRTYILWFPVTQLMLFAVLFVPRFWKHRAQVILTFVGVWIFAGTVLAMALPSVGPCYYGHLHRANPYDDLMQRLQLVDQHYHLVSVMVQQRLWIGRFEDTVGIGAGISAMPSMHLATAAITGLLLGRMGWAWLGWLWVGILWIGSIHLGWHYALDGIVGVLVTSLIWKGVSRLLDEKALAHHRSVADLQFAGV